jgi:hypothetical protein
MPITPRKSGERGMVTMFLDSCTTWKGFQIADSSVLKSFITIVNLNGVFFAIAKETK